MKKELSPTSWWKAPIALLASPTTVHLKSGSSGRGREQYGLPLAEVKDPGPRARTYAYIASISAAYLAAIGLRLSFIVGVSSSPAREPVAADDRELLDLLDAREVRVGRVDAGLDGLDHGRLAGELLERRARRARAGRAHSGAKSASSTISAVL